jgi:hypothetical protein
MLSTAHLGRGGGLGVAVLYGSLLFDYITINLVDKLLAQE